MRPARPFDPAAARDRLERARRRAEEATSPGPEAVRRILEARARELARPPPAPAVEAGDEFLVLRAGGEPVAVEAAICREVARAVPPVEVPGLPPWFRGVVLHRGEPLPAIELSVLLGGEAGEVGEPASRLVVLGRGRAELALLAVEVRELLRLPPGALRPPPPGADPLVRALGPGTLLVLSGEALLSDLRLFHGEARG